MRANRLKDESGAPEKNDQWDGTTVGGRGITD